MTLCLRSSPAIRIIESTLPGHNYLFNFIFHTFVVVPIQIKNSPLVNRYNRLLALAVFGNVVFTLFEDKDAEVIKERESVKDSIVNWKPVDISIYACFYCLLLSIMIMLVRQNGRFKAAAPHRELMIHHIYSNHICNHDYEEGHTKEYQLLAFLKVNIVMI